MADKSNKAAIDFHNFAPEPVIQSFDIDQCPGAKSLWVVRGDLIHPHVSGNKWYKLKYNLQTALADDALAALSFGGPWSNHIHALAAAGKYLNIPTIGIIRGRWRTELTPTLADATNWGMRLILVDKASYRLRSDNHWVLQQLPHWFQQAFGNHFGMTAEDLRRRILIIPEGGSNRIGVRGVSEWAKSLYAAFKEPATFVIPVGSGGTLAGFSVAHSMHRLVGIPVLKAGDSLMQTINALRASFPDNQPGTPWMLKNGYEWGGYGRCPVELQNFIVQIKDDLGLPLDPVYSSKALYAMLDLLRKDAFSTPHVVLVHTGGLQGSRGIKLSG